MLAAVIELSTHGTLPSTSLITSHLADGHVASGPFHTAVHDLLRHLEAAGHIARHTAHGTHRWSPNPNRPVQSHQHAPAHANGPSPNRQSVELVVAVALTYVVVTLMCFAAGYLIARLFL